MTCRDHASTAVSLATSMGIAPISFPPAQKLNRDYSDKLLSYSRRLRSDGTIKALVQNLLDQNQINLEPGSQYEMKDDSFSVDIRGREGETQQETFTYYLKVGQIAKSFGVPTQQMQIILLDPYRTPVAAMPFDKVINEDQSIDVDSFKTSLEDAMLEARMTVASYVGLYR